MSVGEHEYTITLADTEAARAFVAMTPVTLEMTDLNSNEKYVDLPSPLPRDASALGIINSGDIMLYGSKTLVVFYKTFHTSYSYTPIGRIDNPDGLADVLGNDNVRIEFSRQ